MPYSYGQYPGHPPPRCMFLFTRWGREDGPDFSMQINFHPYKTTLAVGLIIEAKNVSVIREFVEVGVVVKLQASSLSINLTGPLGGHVSGETTF